jgi:hypothetical protein
MDHSSDYQAMVPLIPRSNPGRLRQGSGTDPGAVVESDLDNRMIPVRFLMLSRLMRSAWTVGVIAMMVALLLEWGLIVADTASVT